MEQRRFDDMGTDTKSRAEFWYSLGSGVLALLTRQDPLGVTGPENPKASAEYDVEAQQIARRLLSEAGSTGDCERILSQELQQRSPGSAGVGPEGVRSLAHDIWELYVDLDQTWGMGTGSEQDRQAARSEQRPRTAAA